MRKLSASAVALASALSASASAQSLTGPILDAGVAAEVVDVVQAPATGGSTRTRINQLAEAPDASGRLFLNDLRGPLYVIDGGALSTYLDLAVHFPGLLTRPGLATGFVSFAFHPDFASNGLFYTVHSEETTGGTPNLGPAFVPAMPPPDYIEHHAVLTEFSASDPAANVFAGSTRELMRVAAIHPFHNLGEIAFDPTARPGDPDYGLLYVGAGDFGSIVEGEPQQLQRLDTVYGALLRIDPTGGPFLRGGTSYGYGIPPDNPFAGDGDPDSFDEIYAYGFRNPHRLVFDPGGVGAIFVTDIGQDNVEEVNRLVPGANYGWPEREGTFAIDVDSDPGSVFPLPPDDAILFDFAYPVGQYDHDLNGGGSVAIAGGAVYRGAVLGLGGAFVTGDIASGRMLYARVDELLAVDDGDPSTTAQLYELTLLRNGEPTTLLDIVEAAVGNESRVDLRIAADRAGHLYLTTKQDGFVRRLLPVERVPAAPAGAIGALAALLAAAGALAAAGLASRPSCPRARRAPRPRG